jgi:hypothetical protein
MAWEVVMRISRWTLLALVLAPAVAGAQLSADIMVAAAAHTPGVGGTFWRTDLSLHNPHEFTLPVVVQFLPSDTENWEAASRLIDLYPYETLNLWDVLGPDWFSERGTGAFLVYADTALNCNPIEDCQFLVTSRTYTVTPDGPYGEYGQTIAGADVWSAVNWSTFGYAAGILNDGSNFRCNVGIASWSAGWTVVRVDVQDAAGAIIASHEYDVPPFSHVQHRLPTEVVGGSLVYYLVDGPDDARIFGYASVVDQTTGDPSYQPAVASVIGVSQPMTVEGAAPRPKHPARQASE